MWPFRYLLNLYPPPPFHAYQLRKTDIKYLMIPSQKVLALHIQATIVRSVFSTLLFTHSCHHHHKNLHKAPQMVCQYTVERCYAKVACRWGWSATYLLPARGEMKTKIERKLLQQFDIDAMFYNINALEIIKHCVNLLELFIFPSILAVLAVHCFTLHHWQWPGEDEESRKCERTEPISRWLRE